MKRKQYHTVGTIHLIISQINILTDVEKVFVLFCYKADW